MYDSFGAGIWFIVSVILSIVGGIVLYFTFLKKSNEEKFDGFAGWMYDFLTFRKMMIESILKICYLISALFVTLISFIAGGNILACLIVLVVGNLIVRIVYEFSLILLVICRNTTDISKKLSNNCCQKEEVKVEVKPVEVKSEVKAEAVETPSENTESNE